MPEELLITIRSPLAGVEGISPITPTVVYGEISEMVLVAALALALASFAMVIADLKPTTASPSREFSSAMSAWLKASCVTY